MDSGELGWVVASAERLVIVSQTCDIVRSCREHPFITLAAVIELDEPIASQARRGHRPRLLPLPDIGASSFADMNLLVGAEKSTLLGLEPIRGLENSEGQRHFARAVGRVFERPAFPDDLNEALRGLLERIRAKHNRNSPEGQALESLQEIRVVVESADEAHKIRITVLFCPESRPSEESRPRHSELQEQIAAWVTRTRRTGIVVSVDGILAPLDEMTALEYRASDPLDLDYLTARGA